MLKLLADEDFTRIIFEGVRARSPQVDFVRVQDVEIAGWLDEPILQWAAADNRVVVSHDVNTMRAAAHDAIAAGLPMAGMVLVHQSVAFRTAIEQLQWLAENASETELHRDVIFIPF